MSYEDWKVMKWAIIGALALTALMKLSVSIAHAHDAPSGWTYNYSCCSNKDCRPYHGEIKETSAGYEIVMTGEIIPYDSKKLKVSYDDEFHLCTYGGVDDETAKTICLYVPPRAF